MEKVLMLLCCFSLHYQMNAQFQHLDYLGAGHENEITVTVSSSENNLTGQKTVDGFPIQNSDQLKDASRFLAQASFGADFSTIQMTAAMGYEAWLEEQFSLPQISMLTEMIQHGTLYGDGPSSDLGDIVSPFFRTAWTTNNLTTPDLLRQRIAFILSQIFVINDGSDLFFDFGQVVGGYYDLLAAHAFDNYQNLLTNVTLSPAMGLFLSHYSNPKEDLSQNIHPDENYAREIMQLFSIGLWELNQDGTRKYDDQGQFIPTYTNADIKEFAQVFTGLSDGAANGEFGSIEENENLIETLLTPMKMYQDFHDTSEKHLLNGTVLAANQAGMQDITQAIEHLGTHDNAAPFICKSLIKFLTTSNPSPNYVQDVATVFNPAAPNNFQAVISTILLHPEARNCNISNTYTFGKLREPIVRYLNFLKAFQISPNENNDFVNELFCFGQSTGQAPLNAPSVFNFFLPEYQPQGPIGQNYLTAPEFQIFNSTNCIGLINDVDLRAVQQNYLVDVCEEDFDETDETYVMDYSSVLALVDNSAEFVEHLNIILVNGLLEDGTKTIIIDAIEQLSEPGEKLKMALYLILISPDYAILK